MSIITRRATDADMHGINKLYESITSCKRTVEEYIWQWHSSPAGKGMQWVMVDKNTNEIVGHHGLVPFYFVHKGEEFIVAKTENTMVYPEYRSKMIYPMVEFRLLNEYKKKYDFIFSTKGPKPAIRTRKGLGYDATHEWLRKDIVLSHKFYMNRIFNIDLINKNRIHKSKSVEIIHLKDNIADLSVFTNNVWKKFEKESPFTPRRAWEDIKWRFFDNPYFSGCFITYSHENTQGYAVLKEVENGVFQIEDLIIYPFSNDYFVKFFNKLFSFIKTTNDIHMIVLQTTSDTDFYSDIYRNVKTPFLNIPLFFFNKFIKNQETRKRYMPRKLGKHNSTNPDLHNWYVTPFIFEGR